MPAHLHIHVGDVNPFAKCANKADFALVVESSYLWVGEASWLRALLDKSFDLHVPPIVEFVARRVPETPPVSVSEELIAQVENFDIRNSSERSSITKEVLLEFFLKHANRKIFSWNWDKCYGNS